MELGGNNDSSPMGIKREKYRKMTVTEKAAKKALAPFLKRLDRQEIHLTSSKTDEYQKRFLQSKVKHLTSKLASFCKDSIEVAVVLDETSEILKNVTLSEGVSSYLVDEDNAYLILNCKYMVKNGRHTPKYKIEPGGTIASFVAYSREFVMLDDILADERFPLGIPGAGKTVKSVLVIPVLTTVGGKCTAVIELFRNLTQEPYNALDLQICVSMAGWMGAAVHHNNERLFLLKKSELNNYLKSLVELFFDGAMNFEKFISDVIECAKLSVQAELALFYLMEKEVIAGTEDEIVADVYEEGIETSSHAYKKKTKHRFSKTSKDLAGLVARQGMLINVEEVDMDLRYSGKMNIRGTYLKSVLSVPVKGGSNTLGVIQVANKLKEPYFTRKDETLLENIAGFAFLACQHVAILEKLKKSAHRLEGCNELIKIHIKPCPDDLRLLQFFPVLRRSQMPKGFFDFDWIITGKEDRAPDYAVFMFTYLLEDHFFNFEQCTEFILSVKKSYRNNPYHNFTHAFTVCHCMFNIIQRNRDRFTKMQIFALMVATICHDSDHFGFTNNFLQMTNNWLAELYWESPLENHHFDICLLLIDASNLFSRLTQGEIADMNKLLKHLILATDLVLYFRFRNHLNNLLKTGIFNWDNPEHRLMFFGNVMTVCDVSGQCKPFYSAKKVTEYLYLEFYKQGDVEKELGFTPLTMMDREKISTIPENQIQFLTLVCIPSVETLVAVFPNTNELLRQCVELRDFWSDIHAKEEVEIWKMRRSLSQKKSRRHLKKDERLII